METPQTPIPKSGQVVTPNPPGLTPLVQSVIRISETAAAPVSDERALDIFKRNQRNKLVIEKC